MLYLTEEEVIGITGRKRPDAQLRWFTRNGFTAKQRGDRTVLVSRKHFEEVMCGAGNSGPRRKTAQPNFEALKKHGT